MTKQKHRTPPEPPAAPRMPKDVSLHGDHRIDNYFWLREKSNPAVVAYLKKENQYADALLRPARQLQKRLYHEMLGHLKEDDSTPPVLHGEYFYYSRTEKGKNYPIHCRKHLALQAPEEIVLDENVMAAGHEFFSLGAFDPSDDNEWLAYSTDTTGYRQYTLHFKNLRTGKSSARVFERVNDVVWAPDNKTLFFVTEHAVTKRHDECHRFTLGEGSSTRVYFEPDELFDLEAHRSQDRQFIFLTSESKLGTEVRFLPATAPGSPWRIIRPREPDHKYFAEHRAGLFYLRTNKGAHNYRIATVPVGDLSNDWTDFVPHKPAIKLDDLLLFFNFAVLSEREEGLEHVRIIDFSSGNSHRLSVPEPAYEIALDANPEFHTNVLRYRYESMVTPDSYFDYNMASHTQHPVKELTVPNYDRGQYVTERVFATGADGTKIPCSLVYKKGLKKDGKNPLLLYGYGSYGHSLSANFSFARLPLLDRGFIYAIAHVRGGGELGEPWRDAGRMMQKQNTFSDFISCAEFLVQEKYTNPTRLAIEGGSAGGLLMGAVINRRPDLFGAVVALVPFVDVLNTMLDPSLPLTTSEYIEWGNPQDKTAYDYMKMYSPYDNVKRQPYPPILIRVSIHDSQVPYWEGAKFAARLREMKTDSNVLLLKTNLGAGHGGASGRYAHLEEIAFDFSFILTQLGLETLR